MTNKSKCCGADVVFRTMSGDEHYRACSKCGKEQVSKADFDACFEYGQPCSEQEKVMELSKDDCVEMAKDIPRWQSKKTVPSPTLPSQELLKRVTTSVRYFLMNHYLVTSGDKYQLTHDDLETLNRIYSGEIEYSFEGEVMAWRGK